MNEPEMTTTNLTIAERIARAIEAARDDPFSAVMGNRYWSGLDVAARIARETAAGPSPGEAEPADPLPGEPPASHWIPVADRLPPRQDKKYPIIHDGKVDVAHYGVKWCGPYAGWSNGPLWVTWDQAIVWPTHWMEIPGPLPTEPTGGRP